MKNKHILSLVIVMLMSVFCSGCGTFIGTTIDTTVNPDFNADKYNGFDFNTSDDVTFIGRDIELFIENSKLKRIMGEDSILRYGDLLVFVTGHCGFSLPPAIGHVELIYTNPRLVSVEIQDAVTKKQLLLCVYKSGFFSMCSFPECREMVIDELKKAFDKSRKQIKQPAI